VRSIVGQADAIRQVVALQALIADALEAQELHADTPPAWIEAACAALSEPGTLQIRLPVLARSLGISFETFRKRFTAVMGVSPGAWRAARLVDAAARLLADPALSGKEIADRLGFSDEFHFSRRFHELAGMPPPTSAGACITRRVTEQCRSPDGKPSLRDYAKPSENDGTDRRPFFTVNTRICGN
jgi:AraC-like DNA-binding protein